METTQECDVLFEQILEVAPYKAAVVCPLTSHFTNHPIKMSKTCSALLEKKKQLISDILSGLLDMDKQVLANHQKLNLSGLCGH